MVAQITCLIQALYKTHTLPFSRRV